MPATAAAPPVVQTAPSPWTSREKSAIRITPPMRIGSTAFGERPDPVAGDGVDGPHATPQARSAARQARALPAIEAASSTTRHCEPTGLGGGDADEAVTQAVA